MINRCTHFRKLISRYVDNDLDEANRQIVESHVASCSKCHKILTDYVAIRKLVSECYAVVSEENRHTVHDRVANALHFPMWNAGVKLAASIILAITIFAGIIIYSSSRRNQSLPLILGRESQSLLNTPLCATMYYEEIAGNVIHSQYTNIKADTVFSHIHLTDNVNNNFYYESPLFYDKSFIKQKYEEITNIAFAQ